MKNHNHRVLSIENPVIYVPIRHTSTTVEDSLQINLFLQNKPKVKKAQIHVSSFITSNYVKVDNWLNRKNEPNQTQTKPILSAVGGLPKLTKNRLLKNLLVSF